MCVFERNKSIYAWNLLNQWTTVRWYRIWHKKTSFWMKLIFILILNTDSKNPHTDVKRRIYLPIFLWKWQRLSHHDNRFFVLMLKMFEFTRMVQLAQISYHTRFIVLNILRPFNWSKWRCQLVAKKRRFDTFNYFLWAAVKEKSYAGKPETTFEG